MPPYGGGSTAKTSDESFETMSMVVPEFRKEDDCKRSGKNRLGENNAGDGAHQIQSDQQIIEAGGSDDGRAHKGEIDEKSPQVGLTPANRSAPKEPEKGRQSSHNSAQQQRPQTGLPQSIVVH